MQPVDYEPGGWGCTHLYHEVMKIFLRSYCQVGVCLESIGVSKHRGIFMLSILMALLEGSLLCGDWVDSMLMFFTNVPNRL